jgi:hypothetical protein
LLRKIRRIGCPGAVFLDGEEPSLQRAMGNEAAEVVGVWAV